MIARSVLAAVLLVGCRWQRVDGVRITSTADALVGPSPAAQWESFVARTAKGAVTNARIWYGSTASNCNNWDIAGAQVGVYGRSHERAALSYFQTIDCGASLNLLCLQQ